MYKKKKLKMSIDDTQMCAGKYDEEIHDTTEGDSGMHAFILKRNLCFLLKKQHKFLL